MVKKATAAVLALVMCMGVSVSALAAITVTWAVEPTMEYAGMGQFSEGLAAATPDFNAFGYIDTSGSLVIPVQYGIPEMMPSFKDGVAKVYKNVDDYIYVDKSGNELPSDVYGSDSSNREFSEDLAAVIAKTGGKYGYIDSSGTAVIPFAYADARSFSEGLAAVRRDDDEGFGYIDKRNKVVVPFGYKNAGYFSEGIAIVAKDGKYGYIDTSGSVVVPFGAYDRLTNFSEGLAAVRKGDYWGYIDKSNNVVIPFEYLLESNRSWEDPTYDWWFSDGNFHDGLARVGNEYDGYAYIDKSNKVVVPFGEYSVAYDFSEGLAPVGKDNKRGYIDTSGNVVVPLAYEIANSFNDGLAVVRKDGKYGILKKDGAPTPVSEAAAAPAPVATPVAADNTPVADVPAMVGISTAIDGESPFPAGAKATVAECNFLNVRKGPGVSHAAFTYISKGDVITVLEYRRNKWVLIDTAKGQGWIYSGYLSTP